MKESNRGRKPEPIMVLVFNKKYELESIMRNVVSVTKLMDANLSSIHSVLKGRTQTSKGHYYRVLPDQIGIGTPDLFKMTLQEFDALVDNSLNSNKSLSNE